MPQNGCCAVLSILKGSSFYQKEIHGLIQIHMHFLSTFMLIRLFEPFLKTEIRGIFQVSSIIMMILYFPSSSNSQVNWLNSGVLL